MRLRDKDTPNDFIKWADNEGWNSLEILEAVKFECYQTAYRWKDTKWDLVIADEGDFSLTSEYFKFYLNNTFDELLFMTATMAVEKQEYIDQLCPIVYQLKTQDAQKANVLNDTRFIVVPFYLSTAKTRKVEYKKFGKPASFVTSENDYYVYLEKEYTKAWLTLQEALDNQGNNPTIDQKLIDKLRKILEYKRNARTEFLWNLADSIPLVNQIKQHFLTDNMNKMLIFSKRTGQCDRLNRFSYHSKNKDPNVIDKFNEGIKVRCLGVVDAANRGLNLVGLNSIVKEAYTSSPVEFQQQHGRGVRLSTDEVMTLIILVPYYTKEREVTQPDGTKKKVRTAFATRANAWFKAMTADFDMSQALTLTPDELFKLTP